ncbi:MAG: hypothetical protein JXL80_14995 [Planctomycetes bacterium]|nr:hypothetical protein [Planctomycetota bacterium]
MTSLAAPNIERLLAALDHRKLDRVPNFEILIDNKATRQILGMPAEGDRVTLWTLPPREAVRLVTAVGQDAVACSLTWMVEPDGSILTDDDADRIVPPDPRQARDRMQPYLDAIRGTGVGLCARLSGPMTLTYMALGPVPIQSFMYLLYDNRPLVERLMDMFVDYHVAVIEAVKDLPYHFYYIGDDISSTTGPMISPKDLADLWAPRTERLIRTARATGRPIIFHCCGMQAPILPYLADWGVSAVHPLQPVANDIYAVKAEYGDRLALVGNIDVAGCLSFGTADETRESVREHIDRLADDGGYVVCSSHSIIDSVKVENYLAMCEATREFGRY